MAFVGWFDSELRPGGWWDSELSAIAWFDPELVAVSASGFQTYDETISSDVSVASSHVTVGAFNSATSATVGLGCSPSGHAVVGYTMTAPVTVGDAVGGGMTSNNPVSAGVSLTEALASGLAYSDTVAASVSAAGTFTAAQVLSAALGEGVSLAETYANTGGFNSALAAQLTLADQLIGGMSYTDALAAPVTLSDGAVVSTIIAKTLGEAIAVADSLGATHIQVSSLGETLLLNATFDGVRVGLTWPAPSEVLLGVQYGPTGSDFTGTAVAAGGEAIFVQHMRVTTTTDRFTISQKPKREASHAVERQASQQGNKGKNVYVSSPVPQYHVLTGPDEIWVRTNKETI